MTSALSITRSVGAPRAAFVDFPLGHTTGRPGEPELQRALMTGALACFHSIEQPGGIERLPFHWPEGDGWKNRAFAAAASGDARTSRADQPQYQSEEDRLAADARHRDGPCGCCVGAE